jgi:hypothetical protein
MKSAQTEGVGITGPAPKEKKGLFIIWVLGSKERKS